MRVIRPFPGVISWTFARLRRGDSIINNLADLAAGGGVVGAESAIAVTRDYVPVIGCLYKGVQRVVERHIAECGYGWYVQRPLLGEDNYLGQLAPGHIVARVEGAVRVAGDYAVVVCRFDVDIER